MHRLTYRVRLVAVSALTLGKQAGYNAQMSTVHMQETGSQTVQEMSMGESTTMA